MQGRVPGGRCLVVCSMKYLLGHCEIQGTRWAFDLIHQGSPYVQGGERHFFCPEPPICSSQVGGGDAEGRHTIREITHTPVVVSSCGLRALSYLSATCLVTSLSVPNTSEDSIALHFLLKFPWFFTSFCHFAALDCFVCVFYANFSIVMIFNCFSLIHWLCCMQSSCWKVDRIVRQIKLHFRSSRGWWVEELCIAQKSLARSDQRSI